MELCCGNRARSREPSSCFPLNSPAGTFRKLWDLEPPESDFVVQQL